MRVVITPLGSAASPGAAATAAADYLCGPAQQQLGAVSAGGYYADQTTEGPGRWLGRGSQRLGLSGAVERAALESVLRGEHPATGAALIGPLRHRAPRPVPTSLGWDQPSYSIGDAARLADIDARYLRRLATRTAALLEASGGGVEVLAACESDGRAFLIASKDSAGAWRVEREELLRFVGSRRSARVTVGYDVTFSVPKSISIMWAIAEPSTRAVIMRAFDAAVDVGVEYLERTAGHAGRGRGRVAGEGLLAASFTHGTSRDLDPQLHAHVVVANAIEVRDGQHRALDGSGLFAHAKTAAFLAGAELRHQLSAELGVGWRPVRPGVAEIDGVPHEAIELMSSRRRRIDDAAAARGVHSPMSRRTLALSTRAAKTAVDPATLPPQWRARLEDAGIRVDMSRNTLGVARGRVPPSRFECETFLRTLASPDGLTGTTTTFTRGDVVQAIADWTLDRSDAASIEQLADQFLASIPVLAVRPSTERPIPPSMAKQVEPRYTTRALVAAEARLLAMLRTATGPAGVVAEVVLRESLRDVALSQDQARAVIALTRAGHSVHCVVGAAGTGKTHAVAVAVQAWQAAGYEVRGAAMQGGAAERLGEVASIPSETVAAFLTRVEHAPPDRQLLGPRSVLIVDEASMVGTFDLVHVLAAARAAHSKVVLLGDPAQHRAVAAGGGFAAIARLHPDLTERIDTPQRQADPTLASVRTAVEQLRVRATDAALQRLLADHRIVECSDADRAYERIVQDWFADRQRADPGQRRVASCMVTERHHDRVELVGRAQELLAARGELTGPALRVGGQTFRAGDEVMCRAPAHDLHPADQPRRHLRNGTLGTVISVDLTGDVPGLRVAFDGRGVIVVPLEALQRPVRGGQCGVLMHAYALTSHAAQGATFETARVLAQPGASPAAIYVGASRARRNLAIYTADPVRGAETGTPPIGTAQHDRRTGLQALASSLRHHLDDSSLAIERDPSLVERAGDRMLIGSRDLPAAVAKLEPSLSIDAAAP